MCHQALYGGSSLIPCPVVRPRRCRYSKGNARCSSKLGMTEVSLSRESKSLILWEYSTVRNPSQFL